MHQLGPFLSEFRGSIFQKLFEYQRYKVFCAAFFFFGCVLVLIAGHYGYGNALKLSIPFSYLSEPARDAESGKAVLIYGYIPQLNHAIFYLLIAPIGVYVALLFIESVNEGFESLRGSSRLAASAGDPLNAISASNERLFSPKGWVGPTIIGLVMIFLNLGREAVYFLPSVRENSHKIGFTQALDLDQWLSNYNEPDKSSAERYVMVESISEISTQITNHIRSAVKYRVSHGPTPEKIQIDYWFNEGGIIEKKPADHNLSALTDPSLEIDLQKAIKGGALRLGEGAQGFGSAKRGTSEVFYFYLFAFSSHLYEGVFHGFCVWLVLKIIWFLFLVRSFLRGTHRDCSLEVKLLDDYRAFGLRALHPSYNLISWLILIAAAAGFLVFYSNTANGTYIRLSPGLDSGIVASIGQILIVSLSVIVLFVLVYGPILTFIIPLRALQSRAIQTRRRSNLELIDNLRLATDETERNKIRAEIEANDGEIQIISEQTTWPKGSKSFQVCLCLSVILFTCQFGFAPILKQFGVEHAAQNLDAAAALKTIVADFTISAYEARLSRETNPLQ